MSMSDLKQIQLFDIADEEQQLGNVKSRTDITLLSLLRPMAAVEVFASSLRFPLCPMVILCHLHSMPSVPIWNTPFRSSRVVLYRTYATGKSLFKDVFFTLCVKWDWLTTAIT